MKLVTLLDKLKNDFPLKSENQAFHITLKQKLEDFQKEIEELEQEDFKEREGLIPFDKFIEFEKTICQEINRAIESARNGNPVEAYNIFEKILEKEIEERKIKDYLSKITSEQETKIFYRYRFVSKSNKKKNYNKNDIKHCPFEYVQNLGNFRFSLPGFPCLYLGSSEKVSKREIRYRKNNTYIRGKFELCIGVTLLNICPFDNQKNISDKVQFLLLYPLYLSCLAKQKNKKDAHFHEEYIIPQLLLLYVRKNNIESEKKIDGIRYLSTRYSPKKDNVLEMMNYVFPVTKIADKGYDKDLMKKFKINIIR